MVQIRKRPNLGMRGRGAACVLSGGHAPISWRLDVREDSNDCGLFVSSARPSRRRMILTSTRRQLGHYITAGGMRAHRWTSADDMAIIRQRRAVRIMLALAAIWLIFRFIPCA